MDLIRELYDEEVMRKKERADGQEQKDEFIKSEIVV